MTTIDPMQGYLGTNRVTGNVTANETTPPSEKTGGNTAASVKKTQEDSLQETNFDLDEDFNLTPESARAEVERMFAEKENEYDNQVREYYLQIEELRNQLKAIQDQRFSLIQKLGAGTSIKEIQPEMAELDNQAKSIRTNIDTIFLNILALEGELENIRTTTNDTLNRISALSGGLSLNNTQNNTQNAGKTANTTAEAFTGKRTTSNPTATKLADTVINTINTNGSTTGWCLRGVNRALQKAYGFSFSYGSAYQALGELQSRSEFEEITNQYPNKTDLKNLPAGAIVIWGKNDAHPHGHISIALGDGREASDHIANQYTNSGGGYHIFMPKDLS